MADSRHYLLVDGNSIAHANHNATALSVGDFQVQAIFGTLKSAQKLKETYPGAKLVWLWDGRAQWRIDLYPEYKGNRTALDAKQQAHKDAFKKQTPFIEKALEMLGIDQYRSPLLEADDLAGFFSRRFSGMGRKVTMISGDRDWITLVDSNVTWFDPIRDRKVSLGNLLEFTGYFSPAEYVQGKALQGDTSDNIKGIPKMGEKGAAKFLAEWRDVGKFFAAVDKGVYTPKTRKDKDANSLHPEEFLASPEGREVFLRNLKLMDLVQSRRPEPGELVIRNGKPNADSFLQLCERLHFASILRNRHEFLATFGVPLEEVAA